MAAVIDVVAATLAADDGVVAAAGIDDVVAVAGMDRVGAVTVTMKSAPEPVVTCAVPVPVSVTVVGTSYGTVKSESSVVVSAMSTESWRRGEHEGVARMGTGTGRDCAPARNRKCQGASRSTSLGR